LALLRIETTETGLTFDRSQPGPRPQRDRWDLRRARSVRHAGCRRRGGRNRTGRGIRGQRAHEAGQSARPETRTITR